VRHASTPPEATLVQQIKDEARRLGFLLAGVTTPSPPPHASAFEEWLRSGHHGSMGYLAEARSRQRRADPLQIMPECKSILVLALPYPDPSRAAPAGTAARPGRVAAYAWGRDYHDVIPEMLRTLVAFIQQRAARPVSSRAYTDTGPLLERDLAQRAGLGWIGKNTCLIHPRWGSYFLLAEILLDLDLPPDPAFGADRCGSCTRCLEACPTSCILPNRTLDARACISYLTIELRGSIPLKLRSSIADWIFGCDVCQVVCPWNRFSPAAEGAASPGRSFAQVPLLEQLRLMPEDFRARFRGSAIRRSKHAGYLRNVAVAAGNVAGPEAIPALRRAADIGGPLVREHTDWAIGQIAGRENGHR
jgi:epoxyqueuosine reductase